MKDTTIPQGAWKFDGEVTRVFDDMLERSIPQYEVMRRACFDLACSFRRPRTDIVDLGCSRGSSMAPLIEHCGDTNRFIGLEVSQPMLKVARERFASLIDAGVVEIQEFDLRNGYPACLSSVTLAILTLQFVPTEHRQRIIRDVYEHTIDGGALIFVEKILGASAEIDDLMVSRHEAMKAKNGYTQEAIDRKRLSLEGVLLPMTANQNVELLQTAGFRSIDCFWRWMNFSGWIAVK